MRIAYSEAQEELRRELRGYFEKLMTPERRAALTSSDGEIGEGDAYRDVVRQMGADGWLALGWPEEFGGANRSMMDQLIFTDEAAMLREVNDNPYGLSGSIWTSDLNRALRCAQRVRSGVLSINCNSSVHVEAPFGGFKKSGIGRDLGVAGLLNFTELKNVFIAEGD